MFYECVATLGQVDLEFQRGYRRIDLASAYVLCHLISLGPVFQSSMGQNHSRENGGPVYSRPERVRGT